MLASGKTQEMFTASLPLRSPTEWMQFSQVPVSAILGPQILRALCYWSSWEWPYYRIWTQHPESMGHHPIHHAQGCFSKMSCKAAHN